MYEVSTETKLSRKHVNSNHNRSCTMQPFENHLFQAPLFREVRCFVI